ncbi:MAG: hypothetical protein ABJJ25_07100 [Eudoraea sp.]|uniref:hypothetical protein n=1 Tax=Eudoraea sp. TaxID=1979955 RepID=UPI0032630F1D
MNQVPDKSKKAKKRLYIESLAIFLIIVAPFIFKSYDYLPRDPEATINFLGMTIDRNGFADIYTYAWFLLGKIVPFYLLLIWFFTNKHWWYHILLIPICMYAFQIFEVLFWEDNIVDTDNIFWLLPICMLVIPFVYFIRVKLYDKYVHGIDLDAMDVELQYYKDKERWENEKVGVKTKNEDQMEEDLSKKTPDNALKNTFKQIQHSLRSLFNMFL